MGADEPARPTAGKIGFVLAGGARLFIFVIPCYRGGYVNFCLSKIGFVLHFLVGGQGSGTG
jgi:hypothetical protein